MARLLVPNDFIEHNAALVSALPITMACWAYPTSLPQTALIAIASSTSVGGRWIYLNMDGGGRAIGWVRQDSGVDVQTPTTGATHSANAWFHGAAVFSGTSGVSTSISAYSEGTLQAATTTTFTTPTGLDRTSIGHLARVTPIHHFPGRLAEAAIWSAALADVEILALSRGVSPLKIRPANLISYVPVWGLHSPEIDLVKSGATWTVTGTTLAPHAPVRPFTRRERASFFEVVVPQTLTATAAQATLSAVTATLAAGSATLAATAATAALSAVSAAISAGARTVLLTPAEAQALAGIGVLSAGAVTLTSTAAQAVLAAVTGVLARGGAAVQYHATVADVREYTLRVEQ